MAVGAVIENGKVVESNSETSVKKAAQSSGLDKDAFLQLLVAQMKYQDPLEPTSNTEYISQYATFSQVEQIQNMAATMELSRASSMVGKLVEVETTNSAGETKSVQGVVEYVTYENNKAYVSIDGEIYSADDVVAVIDETYQSAIELATAFLTALYKLPSLSNLTLDDKESVEALQSGFNNMTAYQQSFISEDAIEALQKYVERMAALVAAEEGDNAEEGGTDVTEGSESTEGAGSTEPTEGTQGSTTENTEAAGSVSVTESGETTEGGSAENQELQ